MRSWMAAFKVAVEIVSYDFFRKLSEQGGRNTVNS